MDPRIIAEPSPVVADAQDVLLSGPSTSFQNTSNMASSSPPKLYMPIASPPTPAPSPGPQAGFHTLHSMAAVTAAASSDPPLPTLSDPAPASRAEFASLPSALRRPYLASILGICTPAELLYVSTTIAPMLKRDFLAALPPELALHVLSFVDDPRVLARAAQVSRRWRGLLHDEGIWRRMCSLYHFDRSATDEEKSIDEGGEEDEPLEAMEQYADLPMDPALQWATRRERMTRRMQSQSPSPPVTSSSRFLYERHFKFAYTTLMNWRRGGHLLRAHRVPVANPDSGVITSVALDGDWLVVGLANCRIHVFSAKTGVLGRTLVGHDLGVWAVNLISKGGYWGGDVQPGTGAKQKGRDLDEAVGNVPAPDGGSPGLDTLVPPSLRTALGLDAPRVPPPANADARPARSDVCSASEGWGQPHALAVSGGCDKVLRVWDVRSGYCIYVLQGHTSTIRCIRVLHHRPIAVTGSRDATLRVWDVQRGRMLRVLEGHHQSVRCLDVCGNRVVSGSYDTTCRLWNVDTGECLHVLRGHFHQIYSVAFDGERIASGGLDTTVRVWDAATGHCIALLQGHTALVCQLQLAPDILATGGSDGRVITFSLSTYTALQRIAAHDSSVTALQFDRHFLVTGGNDGRVRLFETRSGNYVRELSAPCESVWKVVWRGDTCAVMCKRAGKTVMEIWSFRPRGEVR